MHKKAAIRNHVVMKTPRKANFWQPSNTNRMGWNPATTNSSL